MSVGVSPIFGREKSEERRNVVLHSFETLLIEMKTKMKTKMKMKVKKKKKRKKKRMKIREIESSSKEQIVAVLDGLSMLQMIKEKRYYLLFHSFGFEWYQFDNLHQILLFSMSFGVLFDVLSYNHLFLFSL